MEGGHLCVANRQWYDQVHESTIPEVHDLYQDT